LTENGGKTNKKRMKLSYSQYPASQTPRDIHRPWKEVISMVQKTVDCPFLHTVTYPLVPSGLYKAPQSTCHLQRLTYDYHYYCDTGNTNGRSDEAILPPTTKFLCQYIMFQIIVLKEIFPDCRGQK